MKLDIKICLVKNGYPPQYSPEAFNKFMEQVENFEENSGAILSDTTTILHYYYNNTQTSPITIVANDSDDYDKLIHMLNSKLYFIYKNYSVPKNEPIHNAKYDYHLK